MEKYLIELPVDKSVEHLVGQSSTRNILSQAGIDYKRAKWSSVMYARVNSSHSWAVLCTAEERAYLVLLGAKIGRNLTAEAQVAAQTKLTTLISLVSAHMSTFKADELEFVNATYMLTEKVQAITCLVE